MELEAEPGMAESRDVLSLRSGYLMLLLGGFGPKCFESEALRLFVLAGAFRDLVVVDESDDLVETFFRVLDGLNSSSSPQPRSPEFHSLGVGDENCDVLG